jgi:hypothetical protein
MARETREGVECCDEQERERASSVVMNERERERERELDKIRHFALLLQARTTRTRVCVRVFVLGEPLLLGC